MPSSSEKQARFMRAIAHGWRPDGGGGPSRSVARKFVNADRRSGRFQEGGGVLTRRYIPLDEDQFETYGQTGGEHVFFDYGLSPSSGGGGGGASNGPPPQVGGTGGGTGGGVLDQLDQLSVMGVPIVRGTGSRIGTGQFTTPSMDDPARYARPVDMQDEGGRDGGILDRLRRSIDFNPDDNPDITRRGASVSDLMGSQYRVPNPLEDKMMGVGPSEFGVNNPLSVVGRAYGEDLHIVDPVNYKDPVPSNTGNPFLDALYNLTPEELRRLEEIGAIRNA